MANMEKSSFSHILISAPTEDIAEVYRAQLAILRDSVPSLRGVAVNCVSDPEGQRVGSGGGTLNGLAFIRKQYSLSSFDTCRILMIHSGGESRRAPLYSLCGKAWTTINATLEGGEIASPIGLLIAELSRFCVNIPLGSLVVASSDVMLDIVVHPCCAIFERDSVTLVTVPEKPAVARNHGIIVAPRNTDRRNEGGCFEPIQSAAVNYLQKPSLQTMEEHQAIYAMQSFYSGALNEDLDQELFALVDTGVVVFTGAALCGLVHLMESTACAGCIAPTLLSSSVLQQNKSHAVLRLELYTDFLLALQYQHQQDFSLAVYYARLGLPLPCDHDALSAYDAALSVVWETLRRIPLQMIFVPSGKFEHLGTTAEVLQLLTQQGHPASSVSMDANMTVDSHARNDEAPPAKKSRKSSKLQRFAHKYGLRRDVCSAGSHSFKDAVVVNSTVSSGRNATVVDALPVATIALPPSKVLLEHSLLISFPALPNSAVVSHLCAPLGSGLTVQNDVMLQQIYLKQPRIGVNDETSAPSGVAFTLLVLGIHDDTKAHFLHPTSTLCGSTWHKFFQIAEIGPDSIWDTTVPVSDRCLWNARLFCSSVLSSSGAISVYTAENTLAPASRLMLTWWQDLSCLSTDLNSLSTEYTNAVKQWVTARRVSLADILTCGDATRMLHWRLWLQTAHHTNYHASGRVRAQLGEDKMALDLSAAFMYLLEVEHSVQQEVLLCQNISAVLLGHWLAQLTRNNAEIITQDASLSTVNRAFVHFYEQIRSLGNPRIHHVVSAYLKKLLLTDDDVCTVQGILLNAVPSIALNMHTRVLFLSAWLVKDRPYRANAALSAANTSVLFRHSASVIKLRDSDSFLKITGEKIISTVGAAILSSIQEPIIHNNMCEAESEDKVNGEGETLSAAVERVAQGLVALHLQHSLDVQQAVQQIIPGSGQAKQFFAPRWGVAVESRAPVRIDLAGGWSDTPPICYELSGAVLNVSVLVDGKHPIRCVAKMIAEPVLELHSTSLIGAHEYATESISIDKWTDFDDLSCSGETKKCLLLRAVFVALGVVDVTVHRDIAVSLSEYLRTTFGGGIHISCVSDLPAGSGMGGSSILAAAALHSLSALLGLSTSSDALVSLVSQVEQILTTGGGWQDQVGGIYGGFKLCESKAQLPLTVCVQTHSPSPSLRAAFERRVWLVYTGQQRLARNTLINALRYSALSPADTTSNGSDSCPGTVAALVDGARAGWDVLLDDAAAGEDNGDDQLDRLSAVLNSYWELKKEMAAGSEPPHMARLLSLLRPLCSGVSLCGAGAGGFASVILRRETSVAELRMLVEQINARSGCNDVENLSVHSVTVDCVGIHAEEQPLL